LEKEKPRPEGVKKRGNRAEVRRERKKRDILSPVNVFIELYQKPSYLSILFFKKCFFLLAFILLLNPPSKSVILLLNFNLHTVKYKIKKYNIFFKTLLILSKKGKTQREIRVKKSGLRQGGKES